MLVSNINNNSAMYKLMSIKYMIKNNSELAELVLSPGYFFSFFLVFYVQHSGSDIRNALFRFVSWQTRDGI